MIQKLMDRYARYEEKVKQIRRKASPTAGLFGLGDDPRKHACHMEFYEDLEQWVRDFLASGPDGAEAYQAVHWILEAPAAHRDQTCYWFMYAAHGLCKDLIPLLSAGDCARLVELYDKQFPRKERMPVQKEIYKYLLKGMGKQ